MSRTKFSTSTALALAAVVLSSSTAVYAVAALPKHSVGKKQLKTAAVTNSKIRTHAVSGSKVAPGTFVSAQRMATGKGFATSVPATTVLSLPRLHVTVSTDGNADVDGSVVVHLPSTAPAFSWFVNSSLDSQMFSTQGGALTIGSLPDGSAVREITTHIWRSDSSAAIYLHCVFDTDGFSGNRPLSCWAMST
jgi:hypothetical protein